MKGFVTVETPEEFDKWLEPTRPLRRPRQAAPAAAPHGTGSRRAISRDDNRGPGAPSPSPTSTPAGVHPAPTSFWRKYIFSLDHKVIGKQFLFSALFILVDRRPARDPRALAARLARHGRIAFMGKLAPEGMPGGQMPPEFYNTLFTMHATVMIFFVIIPILTGAFGNF